MSILIAEDNVAQRRYLRELLEREFAAHAPVIEAADGAGAAATPPTREDSTRAAQPS